MEFFVDYFESSQIRKKRVFPTKIINENLGGLKREWVIFWEGLSQFLFQHFSSRGFYENLLLRKRVNILKKWQGFVNVFGKSFFQVYLK